MVKQPKLPFQRKFKHPPSIKTKTRLYDAQNRPLAQLIVDRPELVHGCILACEWAAMIIDIPVEENNGI